MEQEFGTVNYSLKCIITKEDQKFIDLHTKSDAQMCVSHIDYKNITEIQQLRDKLFTGRSPTTRINVVKGNVPVVCRAYHGHRFNPQMRFSVTPVSKTR